jgi:hypothetical protein
MKYLITLLMVAYGLTNIASTNNLLIGSWKYVDVYDKTDLDEKELNMINTMFAEMTLNLEEEGKYSAFLMGSEEKGTWMQTDENIIALTNEKGNESTIEIIELHINKIVIKMGNAKLIMEKE